MKIPICLSVVLNKIAYSGILRFCVIQITVKKNSVPKIQKCQFAQQKSAVPQPSGEEWIDARDVLIVPDGPLSGR